MLKKIFRFLILVNLLFALSGCMTPLKIKDLSNTASLDSQFHTNYYTCQNNENRSLPSDPNNGDKLLIPAGNRITIKADYVDYGRIYDSRCISSLSFIPKAGEHYLMNVLTKDHYCRSELLRYSSKGRFGFIVEKSASNVKTCLPKNKT